MNEQALQMLQQEVLAPSTTDVPKHLSAEEQKKWEELRKRLENWHVRRDSEMLGARHLLDYDGVKLMPRGDLVAVSGKEKSGKTTFCRILSAAVLRGEYMGFRALEGNLRVLWIDTEQYEVSTRTMVRSMDVMCDRELLDDEFLTFNIRGREELSDLEDMRLVLRVFYDMYQPDIVVVDGIRDFIADFNDVMQSAEIVLQCMALSNGVTAEESQHTGLKERKPCCTLCILHQNKPKEDNNMMGHLGATLAKKAGELWNCYRDDDRIFYAEEVFGRTREMEQKIAYKIVTELYKDGEELGIPVLLSSLSDLSTEALVETKEKVEYSIEFTPDNARVIFYNTLKDGPMDFVKLRWSICDKYKFSYTEEFPRFWELVKNEVSRDKQTKLYSFVGSLPTRDYLTWICKN